MNTYIREYADSDYSIFKNMFIEYFHGDFNIEIPAEEYDEICKGIVRRVNEKTVFLDILMADDAPKGFIIFQIDTPNSDWCEFEGRGFIRELYVEKKSRMKGYGRILVENAEKKLYALAVPCIYLTTDDARGFWIKSGYTDTNEVCRANDIPILRKG
jgi:GNAT superfamily N-acetyltransferase